MLVLCKTSSLLFGARTVIGYIRLPGSRSPWLPSSPSLVSCTTRPCNSGAPPGGVRRRSIGYAGNAGI